MLRRPLVKKNVSAAVLVASIVFAISTLSFFGNYFNAANSDWFREHQLDSEQLVLDGILHYKERAGDAPIILGRYSRPSIPGQHSYAHSLFEDGNRDGVFGEYHSQYGLQVKVLGFLSSRGFSLWTLQFLVASGMGLCMSAAYLILRKNKFSGLCSASFPICLALSPWVIVFARNLYWVEFTWFLPSLITSLYATTLSKDVRSSNSITFSAWAFSLALFLAVLLKLLCGYEYITVIYFASIFSFVGLALRKRCRARPILRVCTAITLVFLFAFGSSIGIHARQLESFGKPGLETIMLTASKRAASSNPDSMFGQLCDQTENSDSAEDCKANYISSYAESLSSNPLSVAFRYLLVPSFAPWMHHDIDPAKFTEPEKKTLRNAIKALRALQIRSATEQVGSLSQHTFQKLIHRLRLVALDKISRLGFLVFLAVVILVFWADRTTLIYLLGLFAGSASWYFAAKGHSYIHYHMNYVLWYLIFIPTCVLLLVERTSAYIGQYLESRKTSGHSVGLQ